MNGVAEYLAWQAEMGGDEVILPVPLELRNAARKVGTAGATAHQPMHQSAHQSLIPARPPESIPPKPEQPQAAEPAPPKVEASIPTGPAIEQPPPGSLGALMQQLKRSLYEEGPAAANAAAEELLHNATATHLHEVPAVANLDELRQQMEAALADDRLPHGSGSPPHLVASTGSGASGVAVVVFAPESADIASGRLLQGEEGDLLDRMLQAIHLDRQDVYCTSILRFARPGTPLSRRAINRFLPWLQRELELVDCGMVLLMGVESAQAALKTAKPLEELRLTIHELAGREAVATYHPSELLARQELKRLAWEDLKCLRKRMNELS